MILLGCFFHQSINKELFSRLVDTRKKAYVLPIFTTYVQRFSNLHNLCSRVDSSAVTLNIGVEKLQPALHNRSAVNIIVHNRFNATGILEYDVAIIKVL